MSGVEALRKMQLGAEGTPGTAVPATTIWRGPAAGLEDQRETRFAQENVAILPGVARTYVPKLGAGYALPATEATFEQLPYVGMAGIDGSASGVKDGDGSGYAYTFPFGTTAQKSPKTYTIEAGDNQAVKEMEYAFLTAFTLTGSVEEALMMAATWRGRQVSISSFTGSLSLPTVEEILFSKGKLYIDDSGGTIGTTLKSNTLLSMSLSVDTGFRPVAAADGQLYFSTVKQVAPEILLELIFEHDATAVAEIANWVAESARLLRLIWEGPALATAGTNYTYKTLKLDFAGKWESFGVLDSRDGNDVVTGRLRARYSSADTLFAQMVVVNELSALP